MIKYLLPVLLITLPAYAVDVECNSIEYVTGGPSGNRSWPAPVSLRCPSPTGENRGTYIAASVKPSKVKYQMCNTEGTDCESVTIDQPRCGARPCSWKELVDPRFSTDIMTQISRQTNVNGRFVAISDVTLPNAENIQRYEDFSYPTPRGSLSSYVGAATQPAFRSETQFADDQRAAAVLAEAEAKARQEETQEGPVCNYISGSEGQPNPTVMSIPGCTTQKICTAQAMCDMDDGSRQSVTLFCMASANRTCPTADDCMLDEYPSASAALNDAQFSREPEATSSPSAAGR